MKMHNLYEENFAISLVYYKLQNANQELFIAFHASSYANHTKSQDFKKNCKTKVQNLYQSHAGLCGIIIPFFGHLFFSRWEDLQ